ncbi:MAG: TonB-dependent siderophore receptor, partial [Candidatus Methylumidiphilus sp.]
MAKSLSRPARALLRRVLAAKLTPLALACASVLQPACAAEQALDFNIPPQALGSALGAYADQANVQMSYPAALAAGLKSPGVSGRHTPRLALQKLLAGTGVSARATANGTITLERKAPATENLPAPPPTAPAAVPPQGATALPPVTVVSKLARDGTDPYNQDYTLPNAGTAMKTDTPIMETPFSVVVVPKEVIRDQQVYSVDKAVQNVAGVTPFPANAGVHDQFIIRGFANDTLYRDGFLLPSVLGGGTTKRDPANVERFEVLKGPGSVLFGRTEPGGIVNMVTKKPQATPYYSLQQQFGSYDFYRTTLDATGAITADDTVLYRANLAYQNAGSFRDFVSNERVFFAPTVTWNISPSTQFSLEVEYLHFNDKPDPGIPSLGDRPAPVARNVFVGEPGHNSNTGDRTLVGFNWTHAFNADWKFMHRFTTELLDYNNGGGEGLFFYPGANPDGSLDRFYNDAFGQNSQRYYNTLNLTGKFDTGPVKHSVLLGYDFFQLDDQLTNVCCGAAPAFNIFAPRYSRGPQIQNPITDPAAGVFKFDFTQTWNGLYLQDQMEVYKGVFVMGGMRWDTAQVYNNAANLQTSDDSRVSPRGGVLLRPVKWLSMYGSYSQNFGPSNSFYNTDGAKMAPQTANQWELGAKTEF